MERTWILLGMMGAGKSSVGRALADAAEREFSDTDTLLQNRFGRPVSQIFQIYGEATFRDHESSVLRGLQPGPYVLATGGGIVLRPENWTEMRRLGTTVYLQASPETLRERLAASRKRRPLLEVDDWEARVDALLEVRTPLYEQADLCLNVDDCDLDRAADRLLKVLRSN